VLDENLCPNVNLADVRGMKWLMLSITSDRLDPTVVRMPLEYGADTRVKSGAGETALEWAEKFDRTM
jgi:hypothetical protein